MDTKSGNALVEEVVVSSVGKRGAELLAQPLSVMEFGRRTSLFGALVLMAFLAGCQTQPSIAPTRDVSPPPSQSTGVPRSDEAPMQREQQSLPSRSEPSESISVISALVIEAESYLQQRQWQQAIVTAEQGLRIDRRYAPFYRVLAEVYRALGDYVQAEQFARQGLRFCQVDCASLRNLANILNQN